MFLGTTGLNGLDFVVKCATEDYSLERVQWQWLLGRLYVIDKLFEEFPNEFLPRQEAHESVGAADETKDLPEEVGAAPGEAPDSEAHMTLVNYERLMAVAHFAVKAVCSTHMRIARMSRRVFLLSAKLGAHIDLVIEQLEELLDSISSTSVLSLKRKLRRIVADFQLSEKIVHELHHGLASGGRLQSSTSTPVDSPASTPRCSSPNVLVTEETTEVLKTTVSPSAPPNTPTHRNRNKVRRASARSFRNASAPKAPPSSPEEAQPHKCSKDRNEDCIAQRTENNILVESKQTQSSPKPPRTLRFISPVIKLNSTPLPDSYSNASNTHSVNGKQGESVFLTPNVSELEKSVMVLDIGEVKTPPAEVLNQLSSPAKCCCPCHSRGHDDAASQTSSVLPNTTESYRSRFHTAEQESMSSDDFLDFSGASTSTSEKPVSFKSEVAESPKSSPSHTLSNGK